MYAGSEAILAMQTSEYVRLHHLGRQRRYIETPLTGNEIVFVEQGANAQLPQSCFTLRFSEKICSIFVRSDHLNCPIFSGGPFRAIVVSGQHVLIIR